MICSAGSTDLWIGTAHSVVLRAFFGLILQYAAVNTHCSSFDGVDGTISKAPPRYFLS
jgi:hypothetical protein